MLSIIIPVLNESQNIVVLLEHITNSISKSNISEIIIVDGGSKDTTQTLIKEYITQTDVTLLLKISAKGRAKQMNFGATHATGSILYFLHADSFPPQNFDSLIINEVENGNPAGCFKMKFDSSHWWLKLASWLTHFSWRACRGGDQSQFITRDLFNEIGRFNESYIIYEDNILINELYKRKKFVVIQEWLTTSARLYQHHGVWSLQYHFWAIYVKKWLGASPEKLHKYYSKYIKVPSL